MASAITYLGCFALGAATQMVSSVLADKLFLDSINHDENIESTCLNLSRQNKEKLQYVLDSQYLQTWELSKKKYFLVDDRFIQAAIHHDIQTAINTSHKTTMDEFITHFDDLYDKRESKVFHAYRITISPLVEEGIFRFIVQKVALGTLFYYAPVSTPVASCARIALSSLASSAMHLINKLEPSLQRHQLSTNLLLGLITGVAMERIGVLGAILVHSGGNFCAALL